MLCAISGESPEDPVLSPKSGTVFERRLIEKYIQENGKDPLTNQDLDSSELLSINTARTTRPRPPTLTSIPSLLSVFQNEWDALALETFSLRQHLSQVRQELSNALYENDAAKRVIARLQKERDEARDALSKVNVNGAAKNVNGDAMQVDNHGLSAALSTKVEATQEKLSKTRRKRPVPEDWVKPEEVGSFVNSQTGQTSFSGAKSAALDLEGNLLLLGGTEGTAGVYSLSADKVTERFEVEAPVTKTLWAETLAVTATALGEVKTWGGGGSRLSSQVHNGAVTALALHPSKDILASAGVDKTYALYDLTTNALILQNTTDAGLLCGSFHPDGHLFAVGGIDGQIKIFDVKSGGNAANFDESDPVEALEFSENGIWLAAITKGSSKVSIWDLRKSSKLTELEMGGPVVTLRWDHTGQFLAAAGPGGLTVQAYEKSTKQWSIALQVAVPGTAIQWGAKGRSLIVVNESGEVTILRSG